jgi:hypothetical protein
MFSRLVFSILIISKLVFSMLWVGRKGAEYPLPRLLLDVRPICPGTSPAICFAIAANP